MTNPTSCRSATFDPLRKPGRTVATIVAGLVLGVTPVGIVPVAAATDTAGLAADQVSTAEAEAAVYFYIRPVHASGKCLTVHQASQLDNADIRQYDCRGQQNQQFRMRSGTIGNEIVARHSQRCITVHQSRKANGTPIKQFECLGQRNQHFLANAGLAGGTNIVAVHTLPLRGAKCLNVKAASKANNAHIILWPCSDAPNSLFKFVRV